MFEFEKIDVENILVILALSVSLIMAVLSHMDNFAMSIVTGLLGYIGGTIKGRNGTKGKNSNRRRAEAAGRGSPVRSFCGGLSDGS